MAGDKIGMEVGEEDMADLKAKFFGVGQVLLDIALGVDDDSGRTGLVSEKIGGVRQAAQVVLFQNHRNLYCLPQHGHGTNQCGRMTAHPDRVMEECPTIREV